MTRVLVEEQTIKDIANAIRTKNGLTDTYKPSEMATAIEGIESGGLPENVLIDGTYESMDMDGTFAIMTPINFAFIVGKTYNVTLDGVSYECVGTDPGDGNSLIGNLSMMGGEDTGEPFFGMTMEGVLMLAIFTDTSPTAHTLSITTQSTLVPSGCQIGIYWNGATMDGVETFSDYYKVSDYHCKVANAYGIYQSGAEQGDGKKQVYADRVIFTESSQGLFDGKINDNAVCSIVTEPITAQGTTLTPGTYFLNGTDRMIALIFDEA